VLPEDIPRKVDLSGLLYVQPSDWVVSVWRAAGFRACDLAVWPVGIDVDALCPSERAARSSKVLVYHKRRAEDELRTILSSLERAGLPYRVYRYGSYAQRDYLAELEDTGVVVWHGCHESQGIALQEALAMNVPILVCDVTRLSQEVGGRFPPGLDRVPVTSAPYFDDRCGLRAESLADVGEVVEQMLLGRSRFSPRTYVEENLSLDGQARRFVELWEHFGLSADDGYREPLLSSRPWRMPLRSRLAARSASLPAIASSASRRAQSVFRARLRA
jgi:hypothetical protein